MMLLTLSSDFNRFLNKEEWKRGEGRKKKTGRGEKEEERRVEEGRRKEKEDWKRGEGRI